MLEFDKVVGDIRRMLRRYDIALFTHNYPEPTNDDSDFAKLPTEYRVLCRSELVISGIVLFHVIDEDQQRVGSKIERGTRYRTSHLYITADQAHQSRISTPLVKQTRNFILDEDNNLIARIINFEGLSVDQLDDAYYKVRHCPSASVLGKFGSEDNPLAPSDILQGAIKQLLWHMENNTITTSRMIQQLIN